MMQPEPEIEANSDRNLEKAEAASVVSVDEQKIPGNGSESETEFDWETYRADTIADRRRRHWWMLGMVAFVVVFACLLQVRSDQKVEFRFAPDHPLPHSCLARRMWEPGCPGCGLTRSFIFLAKGEFLSSVQVHRLGWLLAMMALIQIPYRVHALRSGQLYPIRKPVLDKIVWTLLALIMVNWFVTVYEWHFLR